MRSCGGALGAFWVDGRGWVNAGDLAVGDVLLSSDGARLLVESAVTERHSAPITVYNFEVEDWHAYHVGEQSVWVHNANCTGNTGPNVPQASTSSLPNNAQNAYNKYNQSGWKGNYAGQAPGTRAGGKYANSDGKLPPIDSTGQRISYREFDINPPTPGIGRDGYRFVVGSTGAVYYTDSHYGQGTSPAGLPAFVQIFG